NRPSSDPISPTTRISASRLDSTERRIISCSASNLWLETIPAPCRLSTTVCVSSENIRPSASLPIRRIGTDLNKRPLRRIFFDVILATWGRGQENNVFRIPENRGSGGDFARQLRKKNKLSRRETLFQ